MRSRLLLLFFLSIQFSSAQQPSYFVLGKEEFEGVQIYDLIQDNQFNYWFATDQGFYKYDGYHFTAVDCKGLKGQSAFGFVKNQNGIIFCYNLNNQILKIEGNKCSVFYELKEKERSSDIYLFITRSNALLILTKTVILFEEDGTRIKTPEVPRLYYGFPFLTSSGKTISHMLSKDSLLVIDGTNLSVSRIITPVENITGVLKFFRIGTEVYAVDVNSKQYYTFNEENYKLIPVTNTTTKTPNEFFRFYNENDQLWLAGTLSGVRTVSPPQFNLPDESFYKEYLISDVYRDNEGNILLSTFNHGVLVIPDPDIPDVLANTNGQSIVSVHNDNALGLFMGTLEGQLLLFNESGYKTISTAGSRPLQAIYSWDGFPYVLFDDGLVKAYNKQTGKIIPVLQGSLKDATFVNETTLYLALNTSTCKLKLVGPDRFETEYSKELYLRSYAVAVEPDSKAVFVATSDGLKFFGTDEKLNTIQYEGETVFANDIAVSGDELFAATKKQGILVFKNNVITERIKLSAANENPEVFKLKVVDNKLYMNTTKGFMISERNGKIITRLNKVHGFSTNKIFDFDLVNDQLWIAHSKGVQKLGIDQLENTISVPLINIAAAYVNDSLFEITEQNTVFSSDQRKFLFRLSSPTLQNKENIQYHYKLTGYDTEWQLAPYFENTVVYNALEPGAYTFVVKAENHGVFSKEISYSFIISKPFYLRWWFILLMTAVILILILFIYRSQLNRQRKKAEIINEINLSKLTAIQSQMNPHFIFNSLNSIQDLVLKGDIDNSYTFITKFSDLIRRTLNYSDKDFIDFEQEIKLIELYLSLEKLRFKVDLNYTLDTNKVDDIMIPPMLIQPFIENALIHGLLHKEGNKTISIRFELKEVLICTIEDNGVGREKAKEIKNRQRSNHESFSSQAIKKRFSILSQHFKSELGFEYEDLYENDLPAGTRVRLFIPVKRKF